VLFGKENKADAELFRRPDELDENSAEDRLTIEAFIRGLQKLTSIELLGATKKHCIPTLCRRCKDLLKPNFEFWKACKVKGREVEDGARRLECPLCQLISDCQPSVTDSQIANTNGSQKEAYAILKVGHLNGM
jgi:hypothetical protein